MPISLRRKRGPSKLADGGGGTDHPSSGGRRVGFTLVEMLVALSITLLVMAAVVSAFANVSRSVARQRATIEMASSVRQARNLLQQDLAGATCPSIPGQRPEAGHGYIEIIEGPRSDFDPSAWLTDVDDNGLPDLATAGGVLDLSTSPLPASNQGRLPGSTTPVQPQPGAITDGGGLGDADDILMLTVRNETRPFTGRVPLNLGQPFTQANSQQISSPLAEVAWFAIESPVPELPAESAYFGEPGFRSIHRRVLLIAPEAARRLPGVNPLHPDVLTTVNAGRGDVPQALAALVAFQETYDLSVRLRWRPDIGGGVWAILANSLKDLTKRENRFEHHGYFVAGDGNNDRRFPFPVASSGGQYTGNAPIALAVAPGAPGSNAAGTAVIGGPNNGGFPGHFARYRVTNPGAGYAVRPFTWVNEGLDRQAPRSTAATPRAIVDREGRVVGFTSGLAPLGGARSGGDVVMTEALAFDVRVFDPDAPVLASINAIDGQQRNDYPGVAIAPGDRGWGPAVRDGGWRAGGAAAAPNQPTLLSRGAYVDLGYARLHRSFLNRNAGLPGWATPEGATALLVGDSVLADRPAARSQLRSGNLADPAAFDPYRVYDTWSSHYENNGIDEDGDDLLDEGANGFNDLVNYGAPNAPDFLALYGVDDADEQETSPPYDARLRGVQVTLRAYELDSRQIREVSVRQGYVPQ